MNYWYKDQLSWSVDPRLNWCADQWADYLEANAAAYESRTLGHEGFWYFFGKQLGSRAGNLNHEELLIQIPIYLNLFYSRHSPNAES
jgi:hypothetical protein